jgi:outer membrane lipoprotein-sorting protein
VLVVFAPLVCQQTLTLRLQVHSVFKFSPTLRQCANLIPPWHERISDMKIRWRRTIAKELLFAASFACFCILSLFSQQQDNSPVIQGIDAAVKARVDSVAGYTVTEHYAVYRGEDETHTVADMIVKTTYKRETGKSYAVVSESGSEMIRKFGLDSVLASEKDINLPDKVAQSWITSANYNMTPKPGKQQIDGRDCIAVAIDPKRKAPNLISGTIWVDANDFTIVRLEGDSSKAPSIFAGVTHVMRQYANINGFAMATHARAESTTFLYGKTIVKIDYTGYDIQLRPITKP